jgi:uncharacterized protein (DUF1015 family)
VADVEPLRALHFDVERLGGLQDVIAPPYDVIDSVQRARLEARSPYNVVRIDLPVGEDRYHAAARTLAQWRAEGVIVSDPGAALWPLEQTFTGPDGRDRTRRGFLARVRIEEYGAGRIRPHELTHAAPKQDRLELMRTTRMNLSAIFSLYEDPNGEVSRALEPATAGSPWARAAGEDGTVSRLWRAGDTEAIAHVQRALRDVELLIADGHHRYETARAYAEEIGGEGDHSYVLMCLVALGDPGLTVFPTHRLLHGLRPDQHEVLAVALRRDFEIQELSDPAELAPSPGDRVRFGYIDSHFRRPFMLTLRDPAIADAALAGHAEPYRRLDTAVLEALILRDALQMTDEDIDHLAMLRYARDFDEALSLVQSAECDCAFFMAPPPMALVQAVAAAGEHMPAKSTYFYPKVPTGLLFNPVG